jgi:hypothetical protein
VIGEPQRFQCLVRASTLARWVRPATASVPIAVLQRNQAHATDFALSAI